MAKPLPRCSSRRGSQLRAVLTLPASSVLRAGVLVQACLGLNPTLVTPDPFPSPKSSLTLIPPSEDLFSSLPQPRSSAMLFLLLHFLVSFQFAPTQLPPSTIPKAIPSGTRLQHLALLTTPFLHLSPLSLGTTSAQSVCPSASSPSSAWPPGTGTPLCHLWAASVLPDVLHLDMAGHANSCISQLCADQPQSLLPARASILSSCGELEASLSRLELLAVSPNALFLLFPSSGPTIHPATQVIAQVSPGFLSPPPPASPSQEPSPVGLSSQHTLLSA